MIPERSPIERFLYDRGYGVYVAFSRVTTYARPGHVERVRVERLPDGGVKVELWPSPEPGEPPLSMVNPNLTWLETHVP